MPGSGPGLSGSLDQAWHSGKVLFPFFSIKYRFMISPQTLALLQHFLCPKFLDTFPIRRWDYVPIFECGPWDTNRIQRTQCCARFWTQALRSWQLLLPVSWDAASGILATMP